MPTRISVTSATLIDHIFFNCVKYMYNSAVVYSDVSDHLPIAVHIKMSAPKFKQDGFAQRRFFDNSSIDKFNRLLANVDWDVSLN